MSVGVILQPTVCYRSRVEDGDRWRCPHVYKDPRVCHVSPGITLWLYIMEILHLLPTLSKLHSLCMGSVLATFCTVDVNNRKKWSHVKTKACSHLRKSKMWLHQTNYKALFLAVESTLDLIPMWQPLNLHHWTFLSPGPNHTSMLLLHQLLPMFPVVLGNWLAGFCWQWHLTFTVIEICEQLILRITVKSQMQLPHDQEILKLWIKPSTRAQRRAILGYT